MSNKPNFPPRRFIGQHRQADKTVSAYPSSEVCPVLADEYLSLAEHTMALAEARADAFEECARLVLNGCSDTMLLDLAKSERAKAKGEVK